MLNEKGALSFNPETKRQKQQWERCNFPPPKFCAIASAKKEVVATFQDNKGIILTHCIPNGTTVMAVSYRDNMKKNFLPAWEETRVEKAAVVILHQDNAWAHRVAL